VEGEFGGGVVGLAEVSVNTSGGGGVNDATVALFLENVPAKKKKLVATSIISIY
jgi:stress response protein SCP2